ncbi:putative membrane protein [Alteromonadaceae bacterium 2753L.S.0a.02]|nr:putative membrane protein [Alteromonadaceae bacterium 2753L.S.0a.02]
MQFRFISGLIDSPAITPYYTMPSALITNDATVLGLLALILGLVFYTANSPLPFFKKFYSIVPAILLCYFLPSLLNTFGVIDGEHSKLYFVASRYLLPTTLVLLILSVDLKEIAGLGPKAVILFFTGTFGIVIGGPLALLVVSIFAPELLGNNGPDAVWRGMTTVAGSWIGGGANQAAMKEIFHVGNDVFSAWVAVDVIVANIWMAVLLTLAAKSKQLDARAGADTSAITHLQNKIMQYQAEHARIPALPDVMIILAVGFGVTGISHFAADLIALYLKNNFPALAKFSLHSSFFWLVVIASTVGLVLSFTRARHLEAAGASTLGSAMLYILVASIGTHMNLMAIFETPVYFLIGGVWMCCHAGLMLIVAKLIRAPLFFMAVGSQANVGGAASAPVVAAAFHPSLAPVGILLAVLGYAVGTYMAWVCGQVLQLIN